MIPFSAIHIQNEYVSNPFMKCMFSVVIIVEYFVELKANSKKDTNLGKLPL